MTCIRMMWALTLPLISLACADQVDCDPGQIVFEGFCVPSGSSDASTDGSHDAGPDGEAPYARFDCTGQADTGEFRAVCRSNDDCECPAPICAKLPTALEGFCTAICEPGFPACPTGFDCFDPSGVSPGSPKTCIQF